MGGHVRIGREVELVQLRKFNEDGDGHSSRQTPWVEADDLFYLGKRSPGDELLLRYTA